MSAPPTEGLPPFLTVGSIEETAETTDQKLIVLDKWLASCNRRVPKT